MENFTLPAVVLFGFLLIWSLVYWIFPLVLVRLREPRKLDEDYQTGFLAETGTVHRLGRETESHSR